MFTVYKTTLNLDGRYYIGVHKTDKPLDRYLGSGTRLKAAMKKYGRENFSKEILFTFENGEDAYLKEAELVTPELVASGKVFNLIAGGSMSPEWTTSRVKQRRGQLQPNISKAKRKYSPMVGKFLVSFPLGTFEDSTILFEEVDDLLHWSEVNGFSESTVRHLLTSGKTATQGALRGVFIRDLKCSAP